LEIHRVVSRPRGTIYKKQTLRSITGPPPGESSLQIGMTADLEAWDEIPRLIAKRLSGERDKGAEDFFEPLEVLEHAFLVW